MQDMMAIIVWTYKIVQLLLSKEQFVTLWIIQDFRIYIFLLLVYFWKSHYLMYTQRPDIC